MSTELSTAQLDVGGPSARMNAGVVLVRHHLYIFGGSYEQGMLSFVDIVISSNGFSNLQAADCSPFATSIRSTSTSLTLGEPMLEICHL